MGSRVKWAFTAFAVACALAYAFASTDGTSAQEPLFVSPTEGSAGSRFQIVGEVGWTAGETVKISFGFSDAPPGDAFNDTTYNELTVTVLRDGTWSFPAVINNELVPFPLWRPGYLVVVAESASQRAVASLVYSVEDERPVGAPPLAPLGFGALSPGGSNQAVITLALFGLAVGGLLAGVACLQRLTLRDRGP
jgi:hypothetical protein